MWSFRRCVDAGDRNHTVTVTATVADGYSWGSRGPGVAGAMRPRRCSTVELAGVSCDVVTPVGPTVEQALCRGGVLQAPTLEWRGPMGSPTAPILRGRMRCSRTVDGDGDARRRRRGVARSAAGGVDGTSDDGGDVGGRFVGGACTPVVAGGSGDSGDVYGGAVTVPTVVAASGPRGLRMWSIRLVRMTPGRRIHGDGDGDGG